MVEDVGGYDEACNPGEDADLSARAVHAGWAQFFEPSAHVYHEARPSLTALVRQWIWYAQGSSPFFFKLQEKRLEVYLDLELTPKMYRYRRVLATRYFPVPALLFLSPFPLLNCSALAALLAASTGRLVTALLLGILSVLSFGFLFRKSPLRRLPARELATYVGVTYVINLTCMLASILAGLKKRRLFLYPGI